MAATRKPRSLRPTVTLSPTATALSPRGAQCARGRADSGMTIIEVLVAAGLSLVIGIITYEMMEHSRRTFVAQSDQATAMTVGRAATELLTVDVASAGYSPTGVRFDGITIGTANEIRVLADLDGDGVVGILGETDENVSYLFRESAERGMWKLFRGLDLDGDGAYDDPDEFLMELAENIVPVDFNRDNTLEPFLAYDVPPPNTNRVTLTFGVRRIHLDSLRKDFVVTPFQVEVLIRNRPAT